MPKSDVVIVGSGLAALVAASRLCMEKNVIIFTKLTINNSNSMLAQGGVAAAFAENDSWNSHFEDTVNAGCHHNDETAVRTLVQYGPHFIREFIEKGMIFDKDSLGNIQLGQEGAHSNRRILHAGGDATGKALIQFFKQKLSTNVQMIEQEFAVDLMIHEGRCIGVKTVNQQGQIIDYYANHVILATGGCGGLYEHSSNDETVVGDGYAMAFRAGAELVDMEFVQFHPTLLYVNGRCPGLISEAVRGEGAILVTKNGRRIMEGVHPLLDLAPRDIVSRAIYEEVRNGETVYLDITMIENFTTRFPTITDLCEKNGVSITEGKIPIVPGAHFMMGGIRVNENSQSSIPGLYAVGEAACTGVHGANRLASNSLLEGIVFSNLMADYILQTEDRPIEMTSLSTSRASLYSRNLPTKSFIQKTMMNAVGIVRKKEELEKVVKVFEPYVYHGPSIHPSNQEQIELLNMVTTAWLIASSALEREESRGGHFRLDFPETILSFEKKRITQVLKKQAVVN
ncbi:L-aspartate oxidase [Bacillus pinisoli]|uniref:L-aspartate oxidase n=1 Tax=Bacillus pinisoli TaxID=2901866 RepID=UPI001FF3E23C|nr:L-aspartate oxidase [Bacillus pinisoli]